MKKNEVQPRINMTPVWEEKGFHLRACVLGPVLFLMFCIIVSSGMALLLQVCRFLSQTLGFFLSNFL